MDERIDPVHKFLFRDAAGLIVYAQFNRLVKTQM
jgi:hypothetical protein